MFNHYDWGGYLIYQLPEYKTFIDGRMASWNMNGEYILETFNNLELTPEKNKTKWDRISGDNKIGFVLEKRGSKLVKYLMETNKWKEIYSDETSVLLFNKAINP